MKDTRGKLEQAVLLHRSGRLSEAAVIYRDVLAEDPHNFDAMHLLGALCIAVKKLPLGMKLLTRCVAMRPGSAEAQHNLGTGYKELGRYGAAISCYRKAIELKPDYAEAYNSLGIALQALHRFGDSETAYQEALKLQPSYAEAHNNMGSLFQAQNRIEMALGSYRKAYGINPEYGRARTNEALAMLLAGRWKEGWSRYEARWYCQPKPSEELAAVPLWTGGQESSSASVVLHAEQGLGDSIQFVRYVPLVAARAKAVLLQVQPSLTKLIAQSFPGLVVSATGEAVPSCDFRCPLLSLPGIFHTEPDSVPFPGPYLSVTDAQRDAWRAKLGDKKEMWVGVNWAGNPHNTRDRDRSVPLDQLRPILGLPGLRFFSLQKDRSAEDAATLAAVKVTDLSTLIEDFVDTAAIVRNLDLVVTVDTSVAHLSAAVGTPTWILVTHSPDWRWLLGRADSPWYASVRLFRQSADCEWSPVLLEVAERLRALRGGIA